MEKPKIGTDAGRIWQIINEKGRIKVSELKKATKMDIKDVYLALGWLARENKIEFFEKDHELALSIIG